jgi:exosortase A
MNLPTPPPTVATIFEKPSWRAAALIIGVAVLILFVAYWPTVASAEHLWRTSSAYNYGYLIAPISLYLVWREGPSLRELNPQRSVFGIFLAVAFGGMWLAADLMGINEGRHIGFVGMVQGVLLYALGWRVYRHLAFAFVYLWLMVPTGEFLNEPLQVISRDGAILLLKAFAIPVFSEGWTIEVPSGHFIVEQGCSGLNFLLASFALALLYGKLNYRRWSIRAVTILVALGIAIVANIIRVFLIIALTEWSDRRIDIADDHVFFGWVFFGIAMFAAMWWGARFFDADSSATPVRVTDHPVTQTLSLTTTVGAPALGLLLVAFPLFAASTDHPAADNITQVSLPDSLSGWQLHAADALFWSPGLAANDTNSQGTYVRGDQHINVSISYCAAQWSGCDVAASGNLPVSPENQIWTNGRSEPRTIQMSGRAAQVLGTEYLNRQGLYVLSWYESAGCVTASRLQSKICAARQRLTGRLAPGAFVAISAEVNGDVEATIALLEAFLAQWPAASANVRTLQR